MNEQLRLGFLIVKQYDSDIDHHHHHHQPYTPELMQQS